MENDERRRFIIGVFLGFILGLVLPLIIIAILAGCSTPEVNKCTYICPTTNIPTDCYCLEEEINRESDKLLKRGNKLR
jgi:hypothetical protein